MRGTRRANPSANHFNVLQDPRGDQSKIRSHQPHGEELAQPGAVLLRGIRVHTQAPGARSLWEMARQPDVARWTALGRDALVSSGF